jgi:hypothetical protein
VVDGLQITKHRQERARLSNAGQAHRLDCWFPVTRPESYRDPPCVLYPTLPPPH